MCLTQQDDRIPSWFRMWTKTAAVCVEVTVLCLVMGGCIEDRRADRAYQHGEYSKTAKELQYLAEHGDVRAQYDLGVLYDTGEGYHRIAMKR